MRLLRCIAAMTTTTPPKDDIAAMTIIKFVAKYSTSNLPMVEKDLLDYEFLSDEHYMTLVEGLKNQDTKVVLSNRKLFISLPTITDSV
jgi:hypothetical protein